jgi:AcrR family transcriptional regulator
VLSQPAASDWRDARRRSAHDAILQAAWAVVAQAGLAGLSMRDLARQAGTTTPTLYAYFESKNAIYDAMFGQAAQQFALEMSADYQNRTATTVLPEVMRRFVEFCVADVRRYQLLFQRTIPGFEPSASSYAHAVEALDVTRRRLAALGITEGRDLDMLTALLTGLVDQQVSNDPGGDRWTRLIDDFADMFLAHCRRSTSKRRSQIAKRQKR